MKHFLPKHELSTEDDGEPKIPSWNSCIDTTRKLPHNRKIFLVGLHPAGYTRSTSMKRAGALPLSGGITRPFEPEKTRTGIKKRIGLQASELTSVGDREPLEKRVLPLFIGEILTMRGECSPFTSKLAQHSAVAHFGGLLLARLELKESYKAQTIQLVMNSKRTLSPPSVIPVAKSKQSNWTSSSSMKMMNALLLTE